MTALSILLMLALVASIALLIRTRHHYLIMRHEFIRSSDWCARKIEEMAEAATDEIREMAKWHAQEQGEEISDEDALDRVPDVIRESLEKWRKQKDAFQMRLQQQGIPPLENDDDLPLGLR